MAWDRRARVFYAGTPEEKQVIYNFGIIINNHYIFYQSDTKFEMSLLFLKPEVFGPLKYRQQ